MAPAISKRFDTQPLVASGREVTAICQEAAGASPPTRVSHSRRALDVEALTGSALRAVSVTVCFRCSIADTELSPNSRGAEAMSGLALKRKCNLLFLRPRPYAARNSWNRRSLQRLEHAHGEPPHLQIFLQCHQRE